MAELELRGDLPALIPGAPRAAVDPAAPASALLDLLVLHAPIGIAFLDRDLRYLRINETLAEANGLPVAAHLGRTVAEVLPEVAPDVVPLLQRVLDTGEAITGLRLETGATPGEPGRRRTWAVSYYPVISTVDGTHRTEGVGLIVADETDRVAADQQREQLRDAEHAAGRRQALVHRLTTELAPAMTREELATAVSSLGERLLGASVAALLEYDGDRHLSRLLPRGGVASQISAQPLDLAHVPAARDVIVRRAPVSVGSRHERDERYPTMATLPDTQQAWSTFPLVARDRVLGVVTVGWDDERRVDEDDLSLLEALAAQCTIALERLHLFEAAQEARDAAERSRARLDVIARAGELLGASLEEGEVLQRLGSIFVPEVTDWLMVMLPDGRGRLSPRLSFHADPALAWASQALLRGAPVPVDSDAPPAQVLRSRRPMLVDDLHEHVRRGHVPADVVDAFLAVDPGTALLVPMVARGRTVGVLSLANTRGPAGPGSGPGSGSGSGSVSGRRDLREAVDLVTDIARRAALALDNARLFGQRTRVATRLQDSLLPPRLPALPGAVLAARYATAEEAVEVGGDFYDVVPLSAGGHLLVIGDVAGRGLEAAATTGLARHTLRALAEDSSPARALTRLNDVLLEQAAAAGDVERFLTALCAHYEWDGACAHLRVARAGHPAALVTHPDGSTEFVRPPGPLLGVLHPVDVAECLVTLHPGDCLLLYTDGITEARRGEELFGEARLAEAASACVRRAGFGGADGRRGADDLADAVLAAVATFESGVGGDDRALLALHVPTAPSDAPPTATASYSVNADTRR